MEIIWLLAGVLLGGALTWFIAKSRFQGQQPDQAEELMRTQTSLTLEQERKVSLQRELEELKPALQAERARILELSNTLARLETEYSNQEKRLEEQKAEVEKLNERFAIEFKNLANEIFEEKSKKFTDQNKSNIGELLTPLRERLGEFQKKVEDTNLQGEKRGAALEEQLKNLKELNQQITQEAKSLTMALRGDSKTQGNWGEMQLEGILDKAGLQKDIHYTKEQNFKNEEGGNQRLDFIINLPDGKHLILDSKVSLSAYSKYFDTEDEDERKILLKQHLDSLNTHIKGLSDKNYQNLYDINPPDYVMMFVANEPALTIALKEDPQLYEKALDRNIVLVSTTTLLATLRTISYIWKQDLQNKNAEEIARQAGALYDKFTSFAEDLTKLGTQLGTAQKTYQESMKKLTDGTGNLIRRTENLKKLGAKTTKQIDQRLIDRATE